MANKQYCPKCETPLVFRHWSGRLPAKSEALAECPGGCGKFGVRYFQGAPTSEPYQKRKKEKQERGSYRINKSRKSAIVAVWGSIQNYLDHSVIQVGMTQQYKH